jgi:beta-glucanase (GH16 family)
VEEFDEPIDLDRDMIWTWSDGGLSEGDVRFVKDQIKFSDGKMMIEVKHNDGKTPTQSCSHAEVGTVSYKPLLSGEMRTKYNMFRYGRYEASIKAPTPNSHRPDSSGNYISTVFVYRDAKYTHWREIDVEITADDPHSVTSNMLNADHLSGWQPGIQLSTHGHFRDINTRTGFHTYAFEWLPDSIRWFIDGKQTREQKQGHLRIPDMSGKIMMNLWIFRGGGFGGGGYHNNQYPMHSEYDWFRFYKWDNEQHYPCGPDGACLTDKDKKILASNNPCDGIKNEGEFHGHICVAPKNHCNGPH